MLVIRMLGEIAVEVDGARVDLPGRARDLLLWLALHPGTHDRGRVAAVLWPDVTDDAARNNLRQTLWTLRRELGDGVHSTRSEVGLVPGPRVDVDLWQVRASIAAGDDEAADVAVLELLPGVYLEWAEQARSDHRGTLIDALERAAWRAEEGSDHTTAAKLTEHLADLDPYSEHICRDLMRRLAAGGDRAKALMVYDAFVARLREELDVPPTSETEQLASRLRTADDLAHPAGAPLTTVGHRFVGRQPELSSLRSAWAQARRGSGRCAVIAGEPGIGKTRLVHELVAHASGEGALVLSGRATQETLVPYQPWVEALRPCLLDAPEVVIDEIASTGLGDLVVLVPELARRAPQLEAALATPAAGDRYRLFESVARLLALFARQVPVVLVLDDMHWADRSTLLLLQFVIDATPSLPILIVITYRDSDPAAAELQATLAEVRTQRIERAALRGFDPDEVADLVQELVGDSPPGTLLEILHRRTGGNPHFVVEVVRDLVDSRALVVRDGEWIWSLSDARVVIPEAIAHLMARRLEHLDTEVRSLVEIAAVVGFELSSDIVAAIDPRPGGRLLDQLDAAVRAGILDEVGTRPGTYRFGHPLTWEVVYRGLTGNRRAHLHGHVADALQSLRDPSHPAVTIEVARHLLRAARPDHEQTLSLATRAVEHLIAARAFDQAVDLCEAALALVPDDETEVRRSLLTMRGVAIGVITSEWLHPQRTPVLSLTDERAGRSQEK